MNDFLSLARDRYSCREFTDQPVEPQKIDALLEAARLAPTAVNKQPWHAWVVTDPEALAKLNVTTRFGFGAKVVIVLGAARDEAWTRKYDGANFADVDARGWAPRGSPASTRLRCRRLSRRCPATTSWGCSRLGIPRPTTRRRRGTSLRRKLMNSSTESSR